MERVLTSTWFLVATAICSAVMVGLVSWITVDLSDGARALAALVALVAAVGMMLVLAWGLSGNEPAPAAAAPEYVAPPVRTATDPAREELSRRLDEGEALREQIDPGEIDARVDSWIAESRQAVAACKPGVLGYFDALAARSYDDDRARLDAHVARLATIVRDML
jgi:hypothetical protein